MPNRTWLIYVTFRRDLDWMRYSLESVRKFGSGLSGITIVVPTTDVQHFLQFERYSTPDCPILIKNFLEYPGKGFVHHLAMKCYADVFCPKATHILHLDPDCLVCAPFTPEDYFVDGKPVLLIEPFEILKTIHPARYNWKRVNENALKFEITHETMCRHPSIHLKETYRDMRDWMEKCHLTPFYDYVIKQRNQYPQEFCEFGALGAFAMKFLSDRYHFIDRGNQGDKNDPVQRIWQGWSYEGCPKNMAKIKQILA